MPRLRSRVRAPLLAPKFDKNPPNGGFFCCTLKQRGENPQGCEASRRRSTLLAPKFDKNPPNGGFFCCGIQSKGARTRRVARRAVRQRGEVLCSHQSFIKSAEWRIFLSFLCPISMTKVSNCPSTHHSCHSRARGPRKYECICGVVKAGIGSIKFVLWITDK